MHIHDFDIYCRVFMYQCMPEIVVWPESTLDILLLIISNMPLSIQGQTINWYYILQNKRKFTIFVTAIGFSGPNSGVTRKYFRRCIVGKI